MEYSTKHPEWIIHILENDEDYDFTVSKKLDLCSFFVKKKKDDPDIEVEVIIPGEGYGNLVFHMNNLALTRMEILGIIEDRLVKSLTERLAMQYEMFLEAGGLRN